MHAHSASGPISGLHVSLVEDLHSSGSDYVGLTCSDLQCLTLPTPTQQINMDSVRKQMRELSRISLSRVKFARKVRCLPPGVGIY